MRNLLALVCVALLSSVALAGPYIPDGGDGTFFYKSHAPLRAENGAFYGFVWTLKSDRDGTVMDEYTILNEEPLKTWSRPLGEGRYDRHVALQIDGVWHRGPDQRPKFAVTASPDGKTAASVTVSIVDDAGATVSRTFARRQDQACLDDGAITRDPRACCGQLGAPISDTAWTCGQ